MKKKHFLILLLALNYLQALSQNIDSLSLNKEKLILIAQSRLDTMPFGIALTKNWVFQAGDSAAWAKKEYNDAHWQTVDTNFDVDSLREKSWSGIGWFRRSIKIDSTLFNKAIGIEMTQRGASEIYINGKLVQQFGEIFNDSTI